MARRANADGSMPGRTGSLLIPLFCLLYGVTVSVVVAAVAAAYPPQRLQSGQLAPIADIAEKAVFDRKTPGSVILIGNQGDVVYRRAFGYQALEPEKIPMSEDTIFDLASLTKTIATTTAVLQLAEQGRLDIDAPVVRYWPAFGKKGKMNITIRQLLTHYSGLRPDLNLRPGWSGYKAAMEKVVAERPVLSPGSGFLYSDINFEVLGELVRRVSGQPLDTYCAENIFKPLGMKDTSFRPPSSLHSRIAPTQYRRNRLLCGVVHDPSCDNMGGVAGHAGLFSTADDLSIFAQMLLNGGSYLGRKILSPESVERMTSPQSPPGKRRLRGFGWDLEAPFVSNRNELAPVGAYGHLGYTGTALWIDPITGTYIIVLTNRVHPDGKGDVKALRSRIKEVVADALGPLAPGQLPDRRALLAGTSRHSEGLARQGQHTGGVMTGIDILSAGKFSPLKGLRVGLITNHTGRDSMGRRTLDLLKNAPGVKLTALFSPEHGLTGKEDRKIDSTFESVTGLPLYSLYGRVQRPTDKMLSDLDALVFDIQDAGVRFYTYISTMGYAMEAAARKGIAFYVLDRPNPITASSVQGPVMDRELRSFTGYFPLPVRHGMTVGELAGMFNAENGIGADLHVVRMAGYERSYWFDETGLRWVNPSPNLRSLTEAILYPAVALVEGANVSVGRGTDTPFEVFGAPWINAGRLAAYLNNRKIRGVSFAPADFVPNSSPYKNKRCHGVRITLTDRLGLDVATMGIEIAAALYKLYPDDFQLSKTLGLIGSRSVLQALKEGRDPRSIALQWQDSLEEFRNLRSKYLIY